MTQHSQPARIEPLKGYNISTCAAISGLPTHQWRKWATRGEIDARRPAGARSFIIPGHVLLAKLEELGLSPRSAAIPGRDLLEQVVDVELIDAVKAGRVAGAEYTFSGGRETITLDLRVAKEALGRRMHSAA